MHSIIEYHNCDKLKSSFVFINKILLPFSNRLLFYPSETPLSVSINILTHIRKEKEMWEDAETDVCYIEAINVKRDTLFALGLPLIRSKS